MKMDMKMDIKAKAPTKETVKQYVNLKEELDHIQKEINDTENSIAKLIEEGTVVDKVTGGLGGIQGFKIEGFPVKEYDRRKRILRGKMDRLVEKQNDLLELTESVERFIDSLSNSRDRRIFTMFVFEEKTQQQIADTLHIDRSLVSKTISKYV